MSIFQASSDQHGLAETLDFLGVASLMSGDLIASANYYQQAIAIFRALDDRQALISSLIFYTGEVAIISPRQSFHRRQMNQHTCEMERKRLRWHSS